MSDFKRRAMQAGLAASAGASPAHRERLAADAEKWDDWLARCRSCGFSIRVTLEGARSFRCPRCAVPWWRRALRRLLGG